MSPTTGSDLCRVTVVGPRRRIDVSLPADIPFAELFPTLLRHAGDGLADAGLAHGGWVLQRMDNAPFDPAVTPAQAGLRDGEMIYLRPGMNQFPELSFDDVADVVATGVNEKSDRWRPEYVRHFTVGSAVAFLLTGAVLLLLAGPEWVVPASAAGAIALLALGGGVTVARAVGVTGPGAGLGYAAVPYAFLAGMLAPLGEDDTLSDLASENFLAGFAAVVMIATISAFAIGDGLPVFLGIAFAALIGTIATGVSYAADWATGAGVGAVSVTFALTLTPLIPTVAFRMARVMLPPVPRSAEDLRTDMLLVDGKQVLRNTSKADRFVTGMAAMIGLTALFGQVPLIFKDGWTAPFFAATTGFALLLRSRIFRGRGQRLWLLVPGMASFVMLAFGLARDSSQDTVLSLIIAPLVLAAVIVIAVGVWLPGNRPSPFWGRAADIVDFMMILALWPLAVGVLGAFSEVRNLTGG